jgi:hypothetical protein
MGLVVEAFFIGGNRSGGALYAEEHRPSKRGLLKPPTDKVLILFVAAKIKEILARGKGYPWPRPEYCPRCRLSGVWGHGFVLAYFDGLSEGLWLRRYRCPLCGCLLRLRPDGYLSRFQANVESIRSSLSHRLEKGRWPPCLSRSRQGHWMRALRRKVAAYLGKTWGGSLMAAFDHLLAWGRNPVSRSI